MKGAYPWIAALILLAGCVGTTQPAHDISAATPIPPGKARITIQRNASALGPKWQVVDRSGTANPEEVSVVCYLPPVLMLVDPAAATSDGRWLGIGRKCIFSAAVYRTIRFARGPANAAGGWSSLVMRHDGPSLLSSGGGGGGSRPIPALQYEDGDLERVPGALKILVDDPAAVISPQEFERSVLVFKGVNAGILGRGGQVTYDRDPGQVDLVMYNEHLGVTHRFHALKVEAGRWYFLRAQNRGPKIDDLQLERVE